MSNSKVSSTSGSGPVAEGCPPAGWAGRHDDLLVCAGRGGGSGILRHHLVARVGTELSGETISNVTDAVADKEVVIAWQSRAFGGVLPGDPSWMRWWSRSVTAGLPRVFRTPCCWVLTRCVGFRRTHRGPLAGSDTQAWNATSDYLRIIRCTTQLRSSRTLGSGTPRACQVVCVSDSGHMLWCSGLVIGNG